MQNGKSYAHCIHVFCTFGANLYAQWVLINKSSATKVSRKFIKVGLLVGSSSFPAPKKVDVLGGGGGFRGGKGKRR